MRLLIVGAPGSGKGSQASRLSQTLGVPAISTGDLFRSHVRDGTALGGRVEQIMRSGDYVPDSLTNEMVCERLAEPDASAGFILDGYPRTLAQVAELDTMLAGHAAVLDAVIHLVVDPEHLVARLVGRGAEQGRSDDNPQAIQRRLTVYDEVTAPVIRVYDQRALVLVVDGVGSQDDVTARLLDTVAARGITMQTPPRSGTSSSAGTPPVL